MQRSKIDLKAVKGLDDEVAFKECDIPLENFMTGLKEQQVKAFEEMVEFVKDTTRQMHVLEGFAGTGKTHTVSRFQDWLLKNTNYNIALTAPTNKAVRVLRKQRMFEDPRIEYATIHSLLGLKENIDSYGNVTFVADRTSEKRINSIHFLFVDETSMLDEQIFNELDLHCQRGLKIMFVGDSKQIPPVTMSIAIPFDKKGREKFNITGSLLTDIVRQQAGNPIIEATLAIRERPNHRGSLKEICEASETDLGKLVLWDSDSKEVGDDLEELIEDLFTSPDFRDDPDYAKIVAWTNAVVDQMNDVVREKLYGPSRKKIEIGEKIIANTPIVEMKSILFSTNEELEVLNYQLATVKLRGTLFTYYNTRVISLSEDGKEEQIRILAEESEEDYKVACEEIKKKALSAAKGSPEARNAWIEYYDFAKSFADIKYNYAITGHKSQGSTYQNCIVMEFNINTNKDVISRNKIKYTACSRAAKNLYVVY